MRLGIYTDYAYEVADGQIYAERAFALFIARLSRSVQATTLIGRVRPTATGSARYSMGDEIRMLALPFYESLGNPLAVLRSSVGSVRAFWRGLDDLDTVWLLGPHPLAIAFVCCATLRRRRVVLGVRQDLPTYARTRHPGNRLMLAAAWSLERAYRLLARFFPVVVVGPDLADRYRGSSDLLEILVSLIEESDIVADRDSAAAPLQEPRTLLTVGRIDKEKNPMLLADLIARLDAAEPGRWRLEVCGEGPQELELRDRLEALGVAELTRFRGYVSWGADLNAAYRSADLLVHVSLTEGMPQVLLEAFAAGLPCVATDVGGIAAAVGDSVLLVPPDDVAAASRALLTVASDPRLRERLRRNALTFVARHTIATETAAVVAFLDDSAQ